MSEPLRQRKPRLVDEGYLKRIRFLPCCVCGREGPSEAAHLRMASPAYGKRATGMAEKPDDRFVVPLCGPVLYTIVGPPLIGCHAEQHAMNEEEFWKSKGKDPFQIAQVLYDKFGTNETVKQKTKWRAPKVKTERPKPKRTVKAKIPSRPFPKGRKIATRKK